MKHSLSGQADVVKAAESHVNNGAAGKTEPVYLIFAQSEAESSSIREGFWSSKTAWGDFADATRYTALEKIHTSLPSSSGGDAKFVDEVDLLSFFEEQGHPMLGGASLQASCDGSVSDGRRTEPKPNLVKLFTVNGPMYIDTHQVAQQSRNILRIYTSRGNRLMDVGRTARIREIAGFGVHRNNLFATQELAKKDMERIYADMAARHVTPDGNTKL